jgi:hypothetical protein
MAQSQYKWTERILQTLEKAEYPLTIKQIRIRCGVYRSTSKEGRVISSLIYANKYRIGVIEGVSKHNFKYTLKDQN